MSTVDEGALGRGESGRGERPGCTVSSGVLSGGRDGTAGGTDAVGDPFGVGELCRSVPTPAGPRGSQRGMRNTALGGGPALVLALGLFCKSWTQSMRSALSSRVTRGEVVRPPDH